MKRLFQLFDTKENKVCDGFYADKMVAKAERKRINQRDVQGNEQFRFIVQPGPDHRSFKRV